MSIEIFLEGRLGTYRAGLAKIGKAYKGRLPSQDGKELQKAMVWIPKNGEDKVWVSTKEKSVLYTESEINSVNLRLQSRVPFIKRTRIFAWRA